MQAYVTKFFDEDLDKDVYQVLCKIPDMNTSIVEDAFSMSELMQITNEAIKTIFYEKAQEQNAINESNGSFEKYRFPSVVFQMVSEETMETL